MTDTEFNQRMRAIMKEDYYKNQGKEKSLLKYYKKKYSDDAVAMEIIMDKSVPLTDRLIDMKKYNLEKKIEKITNRVI